jgi:vacuolar protein sorting-associated protein 35
MDDQDKLLQNASVLIREQAFFMKKAIEQENLKDTLKFASNMVCELRTSQLSPRFYYEVYMLIFQELQHLATFFGDKSRHGRKLTELYESVQHAGNILPRLYLLVTVGVAYIQSREAPGAEILRDMAELCKGVQHPIRGLFLRYYLLQMTKDKLQSVASESANGLEEVVDFILNNFNESTRLWIRVQSQTGPGQRDRAKRERERHDLRILVGASLVRLSQLEGMTRAFYTDKVLPRILEQVVSCKDPMAQQYLLDCTVQVFPDDFHLESLSVLLNTCSQTQRKVDLRPVLVNLMNRLRNFLQSSSTPSKVDSSEVFGLFRLHLERIMHRTDAKASQGDDEEKEEDASGAMTTAAPIVSQQVVDSPIVAASKACGNILELYAAFLGFTLSLDPKKYDQVSIVHGMALAALDKYMRTIEGIPTSSEDRQEEDEEDPVWLSPLTEIVETTVRLVPLGAALSLSQFGSLLAAVPKKLTRKVSLAMVDAILDDDGLENRHIADVSTGSRFLSIIESLIYDVPEVLVSDNLGQDQVKVCKAVHLFHSEDLEVQFELLGTLRSYFGRGGTERLKFTLPTIVCCAQELVKRVHASTNPTNVSAKKVFQYIHNTCSALTPIAPETAFRLWLSSGRIADSFEGNFEPIAHEFFTQALICFEEELTDSKSQQNAIFGLVNALRDAERLSPENYDALATKTTQHAARLLKKIDQCRAVLACSHLFHSKMLKDPKRVLECLQRGLKIADVCVQSQTVAAHELFVECLNKYLYYFDVAKLPEIAPIHVHNLIVLCKEHSQFAVQNHSLAAGSLEENPMNHLNETIAFIQEKGKEEGSKLSLINVGEHAPNDRKENMQPVFEAPPTVDTTAKAPSV